jgi:hypothetical protein
MLVLSEMMVCFQNINDTGWSILAVSDGAGSASLSREGSKCLVI